jgi:hypothetical protein
MTLGQNFPGLAHLRAKVRPIGRRLTLVIALLVVAWPRVAAGSQDRLPGHVLPALAQATPITPSLADKSLPLTLTLVLKRDDEGGFEQFLHDVYDSRSPQYHHFLAPVKVADRFGPSRGRYGAVLRYLRQSGLELVEASANRLTMTVRGSREQVERVFGVHVGAYHVGEETFYANDGDPELPRELSSSVQAVIGLSQIPTPRHAIEHIVDFIVGAICYADVTGQLTVTSNLFGNFEKLYQVCLSNKYRIFANNGWFSPGDPPAGDWRNFDGTGQKIGLLEFDTFSQTDVADYLALVGFPASRLGNLSQVSVNGGAPAGANQDEVLLDIDAVLTVAPGAQAIVYDAPFTGAGTSFQRLFNAMINDGVTVISNSWAYCEDQTTAADVQSIDAILATAAASGISVFNATGDSGSTCLDGRANTVTVPADSPSATAVGGTSLTAGPGTTYATETWWNGAGAMPPTGQGGFGVSTFFTRPAYQNGLNPSGMRSIPDVVIAADPAQGVEICQASAGGCPSGQLYGGTSNSAPVWAAIAAVLNQAQGENLGAFNPLLYRLAGSSGFHSPASMGSDFAHVGLGSPNLDVLHLALSGQAAGPPSAALSEVVPWARIGYTPGSPAAGVPADGTEGFVVVKLRDGSGNTISGKTVALTANPGSHVAITPPSTVTTVDNGAATFTVMDATIEDVTFTARDTTDGVTLAETPMLPFVAPPAVSGGVMASPMLVAADGMSASTITVTLEDAQGHGAVDKTVALSQGSGRSQISAPSAATTDSNGQVIFTATDTFTEVVTYSATDLTDGDLPVPVTAQVSFTNGSASSCPVGQTVPTAGWAVTSPVTGFVLANNCVGASGTTWDVRGNLWVMNYPTGKLYKFPPVGGAATDATLVGQVPNATPPTGLPSCPHGLTFSKDGQHLYLARQFCGGGGDVVEISTEDASLVRSLTSADAIHCATGIATDPLSGDLFVTSPCQAGNDLFRIANPEAGSPQLSVYASPGRAIGLNFTPDGTIWTEAYPNGTSQHLLVKISGTNSAQPGTVTQLSTDAPQFAGGVLPIFNPMDPGHPPFLLVSNGATSGASGSISRVDLTQTPPVVTQIATGASGMIFLNGGPDGCAYVSNGDRIDRITAADGTCNFVASSGPPGLGLTPRAVSPNPAQGTSEIFTARLSNVASPAGTTVLFTVMGANPQLRMVRADAGGQATLAYTATAPGDDRIAASAIVGAATLTSNSAHVTWSAGKHVTLLTLNPSPQAGQSNQAVSVAAALTDVSATPPVPVPSGTVQFTLGSGQCGSSTSANGIATCQITPSEPGLMPLTATFPGTSQFVGSSATIGFNVVGRPCTPLNCDDGDPCTADACTDGQCSHTAPARLDGVACYLAAITTALNGATMPGEIRRNVRKTLLRKDAMLGKVLQIARGNGRHAKKARKGLDRGLASFEKMLQKLHGKKITTALDATLTAFVRGAKSALDAP